ncbi:MAG: hypothetical protein HON14_18800 [Rhodospirillaceae bacterium]|jgi:hypothetical protein|nr:hypothetical protein [Rhodospirillaceae bacterium]MBT4589091.1 hypothetical protein [Rhodospirillaceae bacterium]MBT4941198.1 hypothetical protein [Rhodospirillaceae bacterium]MBT5940382.1 hypothetical protein [Rhodospirillaceae bacterium]MBT7266227.1 hypothetical protein [Rhodospirillaceae bacterium]
MSELDLHTDCENCQGLCCVAPPFAKSNEFAYAKAEGEPCRHLAKNDRCLIHEDLVTKGFIGCVKFECFSAGQKVTQHHFAGQSWQDDHLTAKRMFHIFFIVKALQQKIKALLEDDAEGNAEKITTLEQLSLASEEDLLTLDLDRL